MPFVEAGVEPEVHTELVPNGVVEVAPLQTDEGGSFRTRGGSSYDWGADIVCYGKGWFYSHGKYMGRKEMVEQVDINSDD